MVDPRRSGGRCLPDLGVECEPTGKVTVAPASKYDDERDCIYQGSSESGTEIELENVPLDFSFGRYLSSMPEASRLTVKNGGRPLPATHLVALALNETCRAVRKGAFYYMPQRDAQRAHPCDVVYTNEVWSSKGNARWDARNWSKRLSMLLAKTQLEPSEKVIPVCLRIFKINVTATPSTPESVHNNDSQFTPEQSDLWSEGTVDLPPKQDFPYATLDDPVVKPNTYQYSRRVEDLSTYIISFNSSRSKPFVCLIGAAEHTVNCVRYPTPSDLSETFIRRVNSDDDLLSNRTKISERAQELVAKGGLGSNEEIVRVFREAFERDEKQGLNEPNQKLFGRVTYLWQEVVNRIEGNHMYDGNFDMSFWPGAG